MTIFGSCGLKFVNKNLLIANFLKVIRVCGYFWTWVYTVYC